MSAPGPFFKCFPAEMVADTLHLTAMQLGAYTLLLYHQWSAGAVPDDERLLARIARVGLGTWRRRIAPAVMPYFRRVPGGWAEKRLWMERDEVAAAMAARSEAARRAAEARWSRELAGVPQEPAGAAPAGDDAGPMRDASAAHPGEGGTDGGSAMRSACDPHDTRARASESESESEKKERTSSLRSLAEAGASAAGAAGSFRGGRDVDGGYRPTSGEGVSDGSVDAHPHAGSMRGACAAHADRIGGAASGTALAPAALAGDDPRRVLFSQGIAAIQQLTGRGERGARALAGKLLSLAHDDAREVCRVIGEALRDPPAEPGAWMIHEVGRAEREAELMRGGPRGYSGVMIAEKRAEARRRAGIPEPDPMEGIPFGDGPPLPRAAAAAAPPAAQTPAAGGRVIDAMAEAAD